jgi:hypothetical protein
MDKAEELAALTGARLTMPTVPLHKRPQGSCIHYFSSNLLGRKHDKPLESHTFGVARSVGPVQAHEKPATPSGRPVRSVCLKETT